MVLLVHFLKQNFKNSLSNKKGSIFIEASITMPLACVIGVTIIQISVVLFNDFKNQVQDHVKYMDEKSYSMQIEIIRKNG